MNIKKYHISFGALHPSLIDQLKKQGFTFNQEEERKIEFLNKIREAITLLYCQNFLTETESDKAYKRLLKKLDKVLFQKGKS